MGNEVDVIQCYGGPIIALCNGSVGDNIWLTACYELEKILNMFWCRNLEVKSSTSYFIMLLEKGAWPIEY